MTARTSGPPPHRGGGGGSTKKTKGKKKTADPCTVFVRYDPPLPSVTRQLLSAKFSDAGPVRKCSVIRRGGKDGGDGGDGKSASGGGHGYAFVKFDAEDDAREAANTLDGITLNIGDYGERVKVSVEWAGRAASASSSSSGSAGRGGGKPEAATKATKATDGGGGAKSAPSWVPSDGAATSWAATDGVDDIHARRKKTARVIVRNLSFRADEKSVLKYMQDKFGEVADVHLPTVPGAEKDDDEEKEEQEGEGKKKGKARVPSHRGFAFVTFASAASANKAVSAEGEMKIRGRSVAIDHSISKQAHRMQRDQAEVARREEEEDAAEELEASMNEKGGKDDDALSSESEDEGDDDDESDDDDDKSDGSDSDSDDEDGGAKDEDDSDDDHDDAKGKKVEDHPGTDSARTIFLRNLPYDADRHSLFSTFKAYGRIASVHLVRDRETGVGRGTAFVRYDNEGACLRALEAAGKNEDGPFVEDADDMGDGGEDGRGGIYLRGRKVFVDRAVDRKTAADLKDDSAAGGSLGASGGKDKRHMYLRDEGRVHDGSKAKKRHKKRVKVADEGPSPWDDLPASDKRKRANSHSEKLTKMRSPLFFVNPTRLSLKNLAKHVDEAELRRLLADGVREGLNSKLVTKDDVAGHWRAKGDMNPREIRKRLALSATSITNMNDDDNDDEAVIPPFHEKQRGLKHYVPSVYIDRDFTGVEKKKGDAPSRGFAFAEFAHHAHALACLRELNNNPAYSEGFAAGGKRAAGLRRRGGGKSVGGGGKGKKGKTGQNEGDEDDNDEDFVDAASGRVLVPRLIVEFTVENAAKAKLQAERKRRKADLAERSRAENKERRKQQRADEQSKKKRGRGEEADEEGEGEALSRKELREAKKQRKKERRAAKKIQQEEVEGQKIRKEREGGADKKQAEPARTEKKTVKPPKKKRKADKEEAEFDDMVQSYRAALAGMGDGGKGGDKRSEDQGGATEEASHPREEVAKKRWFE